MNRKKQQRTIKRMIDALKKQNDEFRLDLAYKSQNNDYSTSSLRAWCSDAKVDVDELAAELIRNDQFCLTFSHKVAKELSEELSIITRL